MEISNLKGTFDYGKTEMRRRNKIMQTLRETFERYGFNPLETPILNYKELLTYKYGNDAEIVNEIYKLKDQGDRDLGLRFDLTIPFCKYIALNRNEKMPFKRYEIGKVFRNGPVKHGRTREFYQCDVDIVGAKNINAEAELIKMAIETYVNIGIVPQIRIGNRELLIALINLVGAKNNIDEIIGIIDKVKKVSREEIFKNLSKYLSPEAASDLIKYLGFNVADLEKILPENNGLIELKKLFGLLGEMGVLNSCVFVPSLARGLNIYTGTVWEVFDKAGKFSSSLGGGGRYDKIITNFIDNGVSYPAVGMSFGLEPICAVLEQQNASVEKKSITDVMIVPFNIDCFAESEKLADKLRAKYNVSVWAGAEKVGKALEYANAEGIAEVIVIGENEIKSGSALIKNMATGKITAIPLK
ncbi:MAG: histidine--tRNA ligase [Christensenellaceae bacterium]|jgi:histidyl-tRNA synthetase|nr:histidine--tRNA ligase [Christensenellaceae bacterium]